MKQTWAIRNDTVRIVSATVSYQCRECCIGHFWEPIWGPIWDWEPAKFFSTPLHWSELGKDNSYHQILFIWPNEWLGHFFIVSISGVSSCIVSGFVLYCIAQWPDTWLADTYRPSLLWRFLPAYSSGFIKILKCSQLGTYSHYLSPLENTRTISFCNK